MNHVVEDPDRGLHGFGTNSAGSRHLPATPPARGRATLSGMYIALRIAGILGSLAIACFAWQGLGYSTAARTEAQAARLADSVDDLWGRAQAQQAPSILFEWTTTREVRRTEGEGAQARKVRETVEDRHAEPLALDSTRLSADVDLDQRLKGLTWYSLYGVRFSGTWTCTHQRPESGKLRITFAFPDPAAMYDDFRFVVNGVDLASTLRPEAGLVGTAIDVAPGQRTTLEVSYRTRGRDQWAYVPGASITSLRDFHLRLSTDFVDIDYPAGAMSPSTRSRIGDGWTLDWDFTQVVTGNSMGVVMPTRIQPGDLASRLAFSAPISLGLFFLMLFVLTILQGIDIHPINYMALAAAFFSFHLLFAYTVDHVTLAAAFGIASATSILLVVSYLRLVVSTRFAFVEAALAQLVYQVGFSLAHFWDGFTGLTVSVLAVLTLFVLMQLTGRIRWTRVLAREAPGPPPGPPAARVRPAGGPPLSDPPS